MNTKFKIWMEKSSTPEKKRLARLSKINFYTLYAVASGRNNLTAEVAARIEKASIKLHIKNKKLPILMRYETAGVCQGCPFASKCIK